MKTKKLTPATVAPVKRENTATVSRDGNAIAPLFWSWKDAAADAAAGKIPGPFGLGGWR